MDTNVFIAFRRGVLRGQRESAYVRVIEEVFIAFRRGVLRGQKQN